MSQWLDDAEDIGNFDLRRFVSQVESKLREAFGTPALRDSPHLSLRGPDIVVSEGTDVPIAIEVVVAASPATFESRIASLLGASVRYRRQFPGGAWFALIVVIPPSALTQVREEQRLRMSQHDRWETLLRREASDAGFDQVLVNFDGSPGEWFDLYLHSQDRQLNGLSDVVMEIRSRAEVAPGDGRAHAQFGAQPEVEGQAEETDRPYRVLLVADEWTSRRGGISTFNRELATAMASAECDVTAVVPELLPEDLDAAQASGIRLVAPDPLPGISGKELLLTRPRFESADYEPDLIIGHGRILGPYAYALQNVFFPQARRLHIVHMDAERLEKAKEAPGDQSRMLSADERNRVEVELAVSAQLVAGVGSLLSDYIDDAMRGWVQRRPQVITLKPGLRSWEQLADPQDPPRRRQVLLLARAEDIHSKGIDIAAAVMKQSIGLMSRRAGDTPTLVIRGVPDDKATEIQHRLNAVAQPDLQVILRPFATNEQTLLSDLLSSRAVMMPSRHEGFGLAAYEAIAAGVPVLLTEESGLARLLMEETSDGDRQVPREVLPVIGDEAGVMDAWRRALQTVLEDPEAAYVRAASLREQIASKIDWVSTAKEIVRAARKSHS